MPGTLIAAPASAGTPRASAPTLTNAAVLDLSESKVLYLLVTGDRGVADPLCCSAAPSNRPRRSSCFSIHARRGRTRTASTDRRLFCCTFSVLEVSI
jgi:hypothetical protein